MQWCLGFWFPLHWSILTKSQNLCGSESQFSTFLDLSREIWLFVATGAFSPRCVYQLCVFLPSFLPCCTITLSLWSSSCIKHTRQQRCTHTNMFTRLLYAFSLSQIHTHKHIHTNLHTLTNTQRTTHGNLSWMSIWLGSRQEFMMAYESKNVCLMQRGVGGVLMLLLGCGDL